MKKSQLQFVPPLPHNPPPPPRPVELLMSFLKTYFVSVVLDSAVPTVDIFYFDTFP